MPKVGPGHKPGGGPKVHPGKPAPNPVGPGKPVQGQPPPAAPAPPSEIFQPGVPTPTIQPFLTAEDMMNYATARKEYEEGLHMLDRELSESAANTSYEQSQIKKGAVQNKVASSDEFAGRGLFRSSVRDADLFDIDATAELKRQFLDTQLNTLKLNNEAQKNALQNWWSNPETGFLHNLELKKVENAQRANEGLPPWITEPGMVPNPAAQVAATPQKKPGGFATGSPVNKPPKKQNVQQAQPARGAAPPKVHQQAVAPTRPKARSGGGTQKVKGRLA